MQNLRNNIDAKGLVIQYRVEVELSLGQFDIDSRLQRSNLHQNSDQMLSFQFEFFLLIGYLSISKFEHLIDAHFPMSNLQIP